MSKELLIEYPPLEWADNKNDLRPELRACCDTCGEFFCKCKEKVDHETCNCGCEAAVKDCLSLDY